MNCRIFTTIAIVAIAALGFLAGCDKDETSAVAKTTTETITPPVAINQDVQKECVVEVVKAEKHVVAIKTSMGDIIVELDAEKAPLTVANFLQYTKSGFYDGVIFHRVIKNFMIQGGGFTADMQRKTTDAPIKNEANNGLGNYRGTIAMARTSDPDSATSQFYINHRDNNFSLDHSQRNPGYAVFGRVIEGMDVVDKIAGVKTCIKKGMRDVPAKNVTIASVEIVEKAASEVSSK